MKHAQEIRLAENLNRLMKENRVSVTTIARSLSINTSTLHNYCNGVVPRNLTTIKKLAEYFQIPLGDLVCGPVGHEIAREQDSIEGRYEICIRAIRR